MYVYTFFQISAMSSESVRYGKVIQGRWFQLNFDPIMFFTVMEIRRLVSSKSLIFILLSFSTLI